MNARVTRRKRWPTPGRQRAPEPRTMPEGRTRYPQLSQQITEAEFQDQVLQVATLGGWRLQYHTHDSRRSHPGFPDLVLAHEAKRIVIFVELKSQKGKATREQKRWLDALRAAGHGAYLWRPSDWTELCAILGVSAQL